MILILVITALATAKGDVKCNFTETSGGQECFGATGQRLIFHLWKKPNSEMRLIKDDKHRILISKNMMVAVDKEYVEPYSHNESESEFLRSGDLILGTAAMKHSGSYVMEEFNSVGKLLKKLTFHLLIQAPVSQPVVSQLCLSPGQMKVSCSSEGEAAELTLTLDERMLSPTNCTGGNLPLAESGAERHKPNVSHVTVCLSARLTGSLVCTAWNMVSRQETLVHLKDCGDFISSFPAVTVAVIAGVALLLLVALFLGIKKCIHKPRPTTVNECNDETEIVYTEVTVIRNVKHNTELDQRSTYCKGFL
ncbi:uncharacterized protein LOC114869693 [Betta splendens]|uniref:Uncharacterized protein LOC114869693 n=1 Tax=Betta splendens TaxID=158456 RepID=A0A6P7PPF9_BETSP|nr:uncharacterized protein LOC114869693 [Betta splendens]